MLCIFLSIIAWISLGTDSGMSPRIKNIIDKNYHRWDKIYRNLSLKNISEFLLFKLRATAAHHLETGLLTRPNPKFYDLVYYDGANRFIVRFPKVRGPGKISRIMSEGQDVTNKLSEYMGPSHNFHGIPTTPEFLGYESLVFIFRDDSCNIFFKDEQIIL